METFLGTLALAAITALCIIAYRHPKGYAKIHRTLCDILIWLGAGVSGYFFGVGATQQKLSPLITAGKSVEAERAVTSILPDVGVLVLGFLGLFGLLALLAHLPNILEHDPDKKVDR